MSTESSLSPRMRTIRIMTLASYYGLILFFGAVSLQALDSVRLSSLVIWLLQVLPLLPFAWGLHGNKSRIYVWFSLVVLLYFIHGVQVAFDPIRQTQGIIETVLCVVLFSSLMLAIRQFRAEAES